jgi:hypothetical protein
MGWYGWWRNSGIHRNIDLYGTKRFAISSWPFSRWHLCYCQASNGPLTTPNNKFPTRQLEGVTAKATYKESVRMGLEYFTLSGCKNWEPKDKYITYKCTWRLHRNASAGISSVLLSGSPSLCGFNSILDRVTFFTHGCWAALAWCFATHTVGGSWDGPTRELHKHNKVSITL